MIRVPAYGNSIRTKRYLDYYQSGYGVDVNATYAFSPTDLFTGGRKGFVFDPLNFSTLFQDAAATTPVTALEQSVGCIVDLSGNAANATSAGTQRPVISARYNALVGTDVLASQTVDCTVVQFAGVTTNWTLSFSGSGTITIGGTAYSAGTHTISFASSATLAVTVSGVVNNADLRVANDGVGLPAYQRVVTATNYDAQGFPVYLRFTSSALSNLSTAAIDFTATDEMTLCIGLRKVTDTINGVPIELSVSGTVNPGTFTMSSPPGDLTGYFWRTKGSASPASIDTATPAAPSTNVLTGTGDISADSMVLRNNGSVAGSSAADQGTGNFGNYPVYIGGRAGTSLNFNGRIYALVLVGATLTADEITSVETWVNARTKAF